VLQTTNPRSEFAGATKAEVVRKSAALKSVSVRLRPRAPRAVTVLKEADAVKYLADYPPFSRQYDLTLSEGRDWVIKHESELETEGPKGMVRPERATWDT
jgi:hypothetical protein